MSQDAANPGTSPGRVSVVTNRTPVVFNQQAPDCDPCTPKPPPQIGFSKAQAYIQVPKQIVCPKKKIVVIVRPDICVQTQVIERPVICEKIVEYDDPYEVVEVIDIEDDQVCIKQIPVAKYCVQQKCGEVVREVERPAYCEQVKNVERIIECPDPRTNYTDICQREQTAKRLEPIKKDFKKIKQTVQEQPPSCTTVEEICQVPVKGKCETIEASQIIEKEQLCPDPIVNKVKVPFPVESNEVEQHCQIQEEVVEMCQKQQVEQTIERPAFQEQQCVVNARKPAQCPVKQVCVRVEKPCYQEKRICVQQVKEIPKAVQKETVIKKHVELPIIKETVKIVEQCEINQIPGSKMQKAQCMTGAEFVNTWNDLFRLRDNDQCPDKCLEKVDFIETISDNIGKNASKLLQGQNVPPQGPPAQGMIQAQTPQVQQMYVQQIPAQVQYVQQPAQIQYVQQPAQQYVRPGSQANSAYVQYPAGQPQVIQGQPGQYYQTQYQPTTPVSNAAGLNTSQVSNNRGKD